LHSRFFALALYWACALALAPQSSDNGIIYLDQGWSQADRDTWYWIPQGSVMMSYDIFLNLELANSRARANGPGAGSGVSRHGQASQSTLWSRSN
jgi:hypothetical protein